MEDQAGTVLAIPAELMTVQTTARSSMVQPMFAGPLLMSWIVDTYKLRDLTCSFSQPIISSATWMVVKFHSFIPWRFELSPKWQALIL